MRPNVYLKELVARCLSERGLPGTVEIFPRVPLSTRLESGERAQFVVDYHGHGDARLLVDEHEISCGTVGAPIARSLADRIEKERDQDHRHRDPRAYGLTGAKQSYCYDSTA